MSTDSPTYLRLPDGRTSREVMLICAFRAGLHLAPVACRVNEDGEMQPVAWCDVCDDDTFRCDDGTCSPCESREPNMDGPYA